MLFFPQPKLFPALDMKNAITLAQLCQQAGVPCRASGAWVKRRVKIGFAQDFTLRATPGDWGDVYLTSPLRQKKARARQALVILAYGMHDLVAKESIRGEDWAKPTPPRGRPRSPRPLSNRERQARFRKMRRAR